MAGQTRHLKIKDGRFYARITVPAALRETIGKSDLMTPLGGDRRAALKLLPEAVAGLLRRLDTARPQYSSVRLPVTPTQLTLSIEQLKVRSYKDRLQQDSLLREASPTWASVSIDTDHAAQLRAGVAGRLSNEALKGLVGNRIGALQAIVLHLTQDSRRRAAVALSADETLRHLPFPWPRRPR